MLSDVGNVTLPTPVFAAGGAVCLLAGYLVGTVVGTHGQHGSTATVVSFDRSTSKLCLTGDAVKGRKATDAHGVLCGIWSRPAGATAPRKGDTFLFVTLDASGTDGHRPLVDTVIYGTVEN